MKKTILILMAFTVLLFSQPIDMAVLNFSVNSTGTDMNFLSAGISDIIVSNLGEKPNIGLVEREKLNKIVEELSLGSSGLVSDQQQKKIGELTGAEFVITGSITFIQSAYMINSKVLEVRTGRIVSTQSVKGSDREKIFDSVDILSEKIYTDINTASNNYGTGPKLEVAFVIDTTGSMGDEINVVKSKIISMIDEILQGTPKPIVKFAVVAFKDRGDSYVTRIYDFKSDVNMIKQDINSLTATGGGDFPESVIEALYKAVYELSWSKRDDRIGKLCFLIGDAEPQEYRDDFTEKDIIKEALKNSLSISSISCSGNSQRGIKRFQEISNKTNGTFSFLTYVQNVVDQSGKEYAVIKEGDAEVVMETTGAGRPAESFLEERAVKKAERARNESKSKEQAKEDETDFLSTAPSVASDEAKRIKDSGSAKGEMKNNLDKIMSEQIKVVAEKQGIKYDDKKKESDKTTESKKNTENKKEELRKIIRKASVKKDSDSVKVDTKPKKTEPVNKSSAGPGIGR
ncbi:MAG TPA: CsgG/HfaB family protein [Clostridiales bacterium]|nr:CsgG/HfaB family protein [Clostridiales bacterium]HQP70767.1 CsgG/HfaB family protein [Clostridiales bacterium]